MVPYPGDTRVGQVQQAYNARYTEAGQTPDNTLSCVWVGRWMYDVASGTLSDADSFAKHDRELCVQLGLAVPFEPAPRLWKTNLCGIRIPGLPPVPGGAADPTLFLSWLYDRYDPATRRGIRAAAHQKGWTHWLLSWPDSRSVGHTAAAFVATVTELIADGFFPCPMLYSKDDDPADVPTILANMEPAIQQLIGVAPAICIGWELSIALSPTQVQQLIDAIAPRFTPAGTRVYVHFQERYYSFPEPGHDNASFWNANRGKLTGVLAQKMLSQTDAEFLDWIHDCLERSAGYFGMPLEIIDGHPVDFVALELSAQLQFNGQMTEAEGDRLGRLAASAPSVSGPAGTVMVMGSGNGL